MYVPLLVEWTKRMDSKGIFSFVPLMQPPQVLHTITPRIHTLDKSAVPLIQENSLYPAAAMVHVPPF